MSAAGNGLSQNKEARELRARSTSALLARNLRVRSVEGAKGAVPSLRGRPRPLRGVMTRARGPSVSPNVGGKVREGEKSSRPNVHFTGFCRLVRYRALSARRTPTDLPAGRVKVEFEVSICLPYSEMEKCFGYMYTTCYTSPNIFIYRPTNIEHLRSIKANWYA